MHILSPGGTWDTPGGEEPETEAQGALGMEPQEGSRWGLGQAWLQEG